jgi:hypothetical protein
MVAPRGSVGWPVIRDTVTCFRTLYHWGRQRIAWCDPIPKALATTIIRPFGRQLTHRQAMRDISAVLSQLKPSVLVTIHRKQVP